VVIVGSILLAFSIDRGYEGYQERAEEDAILSSLRIELAATQEELRRHLDWYDRWETSIGEIRAQLNEESNGAGFASSEIVQGLRILYSSPTFDPSTATLDLIESSGRGRAVADRGLRTLIAEWRVHADDALNQQEALQRSREAVLWPVLLELQVEAPRPPPGEATYYRGPPTLAVLVDSDLDSVLSFYGMLAQISRDDWRQVSEATEAVLERLEKMGF
jgi:hypothetical protein